MSVATSLGRRVVFLFFLGCFIMPIDISAKDSFSIRPSHKLTESSRLGLGENIQVFDNSPYIQPLSVAKFNLGYLFLGNKIINHTSYIQSLVRTKDRTANGSSGEGK